MRKLRIRTVMDYIKVEVKLVKRRARHSHFHDVLVDSPRVTAVEDRDGASSGGQVRRYLADQEEEYDADEGDC